MCCRVNWKSCASNRLMCRMLGLSPVNSQFRRDYIYRLLNKHTYAAERLVVLVVKALSISGRKPQS
jgi:hypothetical protein